MCQYFSLGTRVVRARLFTGGTRRARHSNSAIACAPTIQPWAAGGPTTQENGRLLCGFHNRLRSQRRRPPPAAA
jgi:hypothetical protein